MQRLLLLIIIILFFCCCIKGDPIAEKTNTATCRCTHDWEMCICAGMEYRKIEKVKPVEAVK